MKNTRSYIYLVLLLINGCATLPSIEKEAEVSQIVVNVSSLDFSSRRDTIEVTLSSVGTAEARWNISTGHSLISCQPASGTLPRGASEKVVVSLDRSKLTDAITASLQIQGSMSNGISLPITAQVMPDGLLSHYTFDEGNANDVTTTQAHGVLLNAPSFISDTPNGTGKALFLNYIKGQYINIPYNVFMGLPTYSVSMWIKDFSTGLLFTVVANSSRVYNDYPRLRTMSDGFFRFYTSYDSADYTKDFNYSFFAIQSERWHHIVVICNCNQNQNSVLRQLYVDGILVDSQEGSWDKSEGSKIVIGGDRDGAYLAGTSMKVDNVRFYKVALTKYEVAAIYKSEK